MLRYNLSCPLRTLSVRFNPIPVLALQLTTDSLSPWIHSLSQFNAWYWRRRRAHMIDVENARIVKALSDDSDDGAPNRPCESAERACVCAFIHACVCVCVHVHARVHTPLHGCVNLW